MIIDINVTHNTLYVHKIYNKIHSNVYGTSHNLNKRATLNKGDSLFLFKQLPFQSQFVMLKYKELIAPAVDSRQQQ